MEALVEACIWQAAGTRNDIGRAITSQLQLQGKLDMLSTVLQMKKPKLAERFQKVTAYIRECLIGKRNLAIHGHWLGLTGANATVVMKFSGKGRLVQQGGHISVNDLNDLASDIADVAVWLLDLCQTLPPLRQRRGGLGIQRQEPPNPQGCATRKTQALQFLPSQKLPRATKPLPRIQTTRKNR
jgi:hypothetical protein